MKTSKFKLHFVKILISIITIFYFTFLYMDFFKIQAYISSNIIKFLSMILVFLISLLIGKDGISKRDTSLLRTGIFITLIADIFLLLLNKNYTLGVGLFCIVQITYSIRYKTDDAKITIRNFIRLFIIIILIYIVIDTLIIKIDFLLILAIYYAICLLSTTYKAINLYKNKSYPKLNGKIIALGMILFLLCDINVALYNIIKFLPISSEATMFLNDLSSISMWMFYLPSQVLLVSSGYSSKHLNKITS